MSQTRNVHGAFVLVAWVLNHYAFNHYDIWYSVIDDGSHLILNFELDSTGFKQTTIQISET